MLDTTVPTSLFDRTLGNLRRLWREVSSILPGATSETLDGDLDGGSAEQLRARMLECLEARGGEVSGRARAADLGEAYLHLTPLGRKRFLALLAGDFGLDRERLRGLTERYVKTNDLTEQRALENEMRDALTSQRLRLLTQFNALPQGVKFLVDMRADLLNHTRDDPSLAALDGDMRRLLTSWFDVGFLDLKRITWDSPASLLEKLIAYEAVHKIRSWGDLHNRLDSDRRCYAFFHPRMPDEPVIFVQVALVPSMAGNIQELLDEAAPRSDPKLATNAIFYSISNAQVGLRGIGFGDFLIKKVVDNLSRDFPALKNFATLSPIPGFARWLRGLDEAALAALIAPKPQAAIKAALEARRIEGDLRDLLARADWFEDAATLGAVREPLLALGAHYLLREMRKGEPLDPVARFHLDNGANVERLNWLADVSAKGIEESYGLMVNYRYRLEEIDANHEALATSGTIAASDQVRTLLPKPREGAKFSLFGAAR